MRTYSNMHEAWFYAMNIQSNGILDWYSRSDDTGNTESEKQKSKFLFCLIILLLFRHFSLVVTDQTDSQLP